MSDAFGGWSEGKGRVRSLMFVGQLALLTLLSSCSSFPNSYEARLADHLSATGAKMYGAYWCPHCAAQKEYFGAAAGQLPYVECDPEGFNAQPDLCQAEGIEAYPTWIIDGQRYLGSQTLGKLARLSGLEGEAIPGDRFQGNLDPPSDNSLDNPSGNPSDNYSPAQ